jgi:hypothetical protein
VAAEFVCPKRCKREGVPGGGLDRDGFLGWGKRYRDARGSPFESRSRHDGEEESAK